MDSTSPLTPSNAKPNSAPSSAPTAPLGSPDALIRLPIDLDRLRSSTEAATAVEQARTVTEPSSTELPMQPDDVVAPPARASRTSPVPGRWMKLAVPLAAVGSFATVALAMGSGDNSDRNAQTPSLSRPIVVADATKVGGPTRPTSTAAKSNTAPSTTAPATTTAAPTTAAPTTVPPAPVVAAPVDPSAPPDHKAIYRGGKLYLEGRVNSDAEAQNYIAKASAVLGPDNVVNSYAIDPAVPPSTDGTVYVDEPFLFEVGSAALNPAYTQVLGLGIAAMNLNPNARMSVTGHTDSRGDPEENRRLSRSRADAVVAYMVANGGIDPSRFDAVGAGDSAPVGDNATDEGRRLNRRIEVKLINLLG